MRRRENTAFTLVETLIATLIMVIVGAGVYTLIRSAYDSQYMLMSQNNANGDARAAVDYLADHMRGAAGLTAATASDVTFTDNTGSSIRYWRASDGTLRTTVNSAPTGGTQIYNGLQSLTMTYYSWSGSYWTASSSPATPGNVSAIDIKAVGSVGGYTRQVSSRVKLRQK